MLNTRRKLRSGNGIHCGPQGSSSEEDEEDSGPSSRAEKLCRPAVDDAPVFYPTEEEFIDTLVYIAKIRPEAEKYGICRIVPPKSWKPPCPLRDEDLWNFKTFNTRTQEINRLQNREPVRKKSMSTRKRKRRGQLRFGMTRRCRTSKPKNDECTSDSEEKFGFQSGEDFTLAEFQKYADDFKDGYFESRTASVEEIESEYWRIIESPNEEVEVCYGADIDTALFGSGFPRASTSKSEVDSYVSSGWNLNNIPRLQGSILSFEKDDISGVSVPWLYVGMCFSSFCWHVEDHHLYSLNFMHFGEQKVWYGVPGQDAVKLEEAMRRHLPHLFEEQPGLLHDLVTQLSPTILKSEGISVCRVVQNPGEFVLTLPRAYHSGFNCGFNCAEAVNVAPVDWLPHGQCAVELYREQRRKTSLSHDKLLLEVARRAVHELYEFHVKRENSRGSYIWQGSCGRNGLLTEAVKTRVEMEHRAREQLCSSIHIAKITEDIDSSGERECYLCHYDLHLSFISCECSPNRVACLSHSSFTCSCEPSKRFLHVRYDMNELQTLLAALDCDLSALRCLVEGYLEQSLLPEFVNAEKIDKEGSSEPFSPSVYVDAGNATNDVENDKIGVHPVAITSKLQEPETIQQVSMLNYGEKSYGGCFDLNMEEPSDDYVPPVYSCNSSDTGSIVNSASKNSHLQVTAGPVRSNSICSSSLDLNRCSNGSPELSNLSRKGSTKIFGVDVSSYGHCSPSPANGSSGNCPGVPSPRYFVEVLDFGEVMHSPKWCSKEAIFPKGYRSRVMFPSVLDPTNMCSYISEILSVGLIGPVFKVKVEKQPEIYFTDTSAVGCWNLVRERVNNEIVRKFIVPQLLPPESVNGLELYGFLLPQIIETVETLDPFHRCSEYWSAKSASRTEEQSSVQQKGREDAVWTSHPSIMLLGVDIARKDQGDGSGSGTKTKTDPSDEAVRDILGHLFEKGTLPELWMMERVLIGGSGTNGWKTAISALEQEVSRKTQQEKSGK